MRFVAAIDLSPADIREAAKKRVFSKRIEKEGMLRQIAWKLTQEKLVLIVLRLLLNGVPWLADNIEPAGSVHGSPGEESC
jgi:hypothetical protein